MKRKLPSWLLTDPIAHRGYHSNDSVIPENSLAAFQNALDNGFPIEVDIKVLADGKAVAFHDSSLKRMCGVERPVSEVSSLELKNFKLLQSQEKIPLLSEVLRLVDGKVPLLIETKNFGRAGRFEKIVIGELSHYRGPFVIHSFNPLTLNWLANNHPSIIRGQILSKFREKEMSPFTKNFFTHLYVNVFSKPDFIAYDFRNLTSPSAKKFRGKHVPILAWTLRNPDDMKSISGLADNIIFENFNPRLV